MNEKHPSTNKIELFIITIFGQYPTDQSSGSVVETIIIVERNQGEVSYYKNERAECVCQYTCEVFHLPIGDT